MIDPENRKDRVLLPHQALWEIYATDPTDPLSTPENADINDPTAQRPGKNDPAKARGTVEP